MALYDCFKQEKPIEILSKEDLVNIHLTSVEILETVGIKYENDKVLGLFLEHGCEVDESRKIVKLKEDFIDQCIRSVPHSFSLYSRIFDELRIGEGHFHFVSTIDNSHIIDSETLERRVGKLSDIKNLARLIDKLDFYHICCNPVIANDIHPRLRVIYAAAEILKNTEKHCIVCPTSGSEAKYFILLGSVITGSEEELSKKPIISTGIAPTSPLTLTNSTCEVIWEFAEKKLPFIIIHAPISGATSPVTMAGTIALANAESLAELVLSQLINEGTAVVYGGATVSMDMRFATLAYGAVEYGLFGISTAQMARFYNLPSYGAGGGTNANLSDVQSGYEKMSSSMLTYLAGHDMMCDAGLNSNALTSVDSIVIQDEIMSMIARIASGFEVTEETLAPDIIKKINVGGDYLSEKHTRNHFKTDYIYSELSNRESYEVWLTKGGLELNSKALQKGKEIIKKHEPAPLTKEENIKINTILKKVEKEL